ncbi:hypothetical protein BDV12DRAFT_39969 [Aspergillus spectabilis]
MIMRCVSSRVFILVGSRISAQAWSPSLGSSLGSSLCPMLQLSNNCSTWKGFIQHVQSSIGFRPFRCAPPSASSTNERQTRALLGLRVRSCLQVHHNLRKLTPASAAQVAIFRSIPTRRTRLQVITRNSSM